MSTPSPEVLEALRRVLAVNRDPVIAEVGPGIGATAVEILRLLDGRGRLHIFGFEDEVAALAADLIANDLVRGTELVFHPNARTTYDSYAWTLGQMVRDARKAGGRPPTFDLVYLDAAHAFQHDAPAAVLLKEMVARGGYLIFDDMHWSFSTSPTMNPARNPTVLDDYSQPLLDTPHVG